MTRIMFDSVTIGEIPETAQIVAGYVDGDFQTFGPLVRRFPRAQHLSIAVHTSEDADCLDVERGDATAGQAAAWVIRQHHDRPHSRPVIYASRDLLPEILQLLTRAGLPRRTYRVWSAHYTGPHICAPETCGATFTADACQWTDRALGRNLDESLLQDTFLPAPARRRRLPRPLPKAHPKVKGSAAGGTLAVVISAVLEQFGIVHLTPAEASGLATLIAATAGWLIPSYRRRA